MKFQTHNDSPDINTNMTCLQGYIQARRCDLERLFGAPTEEEGDKVTTHWSVKFAGDVVATIYDWKTDAPGLEEDFVWHIGGHTRLAVNLVHDAFRVSRNLSVRSA